VGARIHYRSVARQISKENGTETATSPYQDTLVRPNLPDRTESAEIVATGPEGLVGNRMMTARVDARGSTYDVFFPTVGLHSDVRPAEGDLSQSRSHFRAIVGGLAVGRRLDWFTERLSWESFQHYLGATNLLVTELTWRDGPIRVLVTDFMVMGDCLPKMAGGVDSPGQYLKRFRVMNEGDETRRALFGVYIQAEVNGGVGETGLSWRDHERTLLATNQGHLHVNRKLARNSTVEFAVALDDRGEVHCEPTGPNEAMLLRWLTLPPHETVTVDLIVSGAFTGWRGDPGTFEHWLRPALSWFRASDLDHVEQRTGLEWDAFVEPLPNLHFPRPGYAVALRRSALAAALHADATWGAIASAFDRGLNAYCWPREAVWVGGTFVRMGHPEIGRHALRWLFQIRDKGRPYHYWFQKYTIDGYPEWEAPAVDQAAVILWGLAAYYQRTGDLDAVVSCWPMVEQAAAVCGGASGHPGLTFLDDLQLVTSSSVWDQRYGAFLYSNVSVVAGLRAAVRLAETVDQTASAASWQALADRIWETGILSESVQGRCDQPGLVDSETGRFLDARRLSTLRGLWTSRPELLIDRSATLDISMLGPSVPFGLLPAADRRLARTAEALLRDSVAGGDPNALTRFAFDTTKVGRGEVTPTARIRDVSSLATLWMARYLIQLGRETGQVRHWNRALGMLDTIIGRLLPLGLGFRPQGRGGDAPRATQGGLSGVLSLHAMLMETMLDFAGLDYDAVDRRFSLSPTLPSSWPHTGLTQNFPCGEVAYRLERPIGGTVHRLSIRSQLRHPVTLMADVTCPGLIEMGPWQSDPPAPPPEFDRRSGRLSWSVELPAGESFRSWTWG
jgi:GH15 family glucan-1,4-alpha-glucosidase